MIGFKPIIKTGAIKVSVNGSPTGEIRNNAGGTRVLAVQHPCEFTLSDLARLLAQFGAKVSMDPESIEAKTAQQQTVLTAGRALRLGVPTAVPAPAPAKKTALKRAAAKKPASRKRK